MNGLANEFFDMKLEGYDDGILVKGLASGTKAYGIGSCIVVVGDSSGMHHQVCLEDVLYVPNLLHQHPRVFSVISACSQDDYTCHFQSNSYVLNIKSATIDLHLCKGLLWIPTVDPSTVSNFVSVIIKIRDAESSMMFLAHNGLTNTISLPGTYVRDTKTLNECGLRVILSFLGVRLERQNQLFLRNSSTIILEDRTPIRYHTYQCKFWLEELDSMKPCDAVACVQLCKQFRKILGLTYQLTNYKPEHPDDSDYGLLVDTNDVAAVVLSHSKVYGFEFSTVSPHFDLWSLGDTLSRIFPYKLNGTYFMNASGTIPVP
jgi:hypothetical protein